MRIPTVGRYLINFWKDGRCFRSVKVDAPTKFLAWLNAWSEDVTVLQDKIGADKITITRMRRAK